VALPPKFWFKLQKLKTAFRSALSAGEQSYETALRMCPSCRGLIDRGASVCPLCGAPTKPPRSRAGAGSGQVLGGLIAVPSTATSALIAVNVALYFVSWYLTQAAASAELGSAPGMGGIRDDVLVHLGAKFGPLIYTGQWWRLVTAVFLHRDLIHIGFNLLCLFRLGPEVESLFGTAKFLVIYLVTGVAGFMLSLWSSLGSSIGASGAILGLIGVVLVVSFRYGSAGKQYRAMLWQWLLYILIISLLPGVDMAAHLGGFISGVALGLVIPEGEPETRAGENLWNALAVFSVLVIAGSFVLMALQLNHPLR